MLKILYTFLASILLLSCAAQRTTEGIEVLAYRQVILGGPAPPVMTDEQGNPKEIPMKERAEYFIYIVSAPTNIKVIDLWVRKDYYSASTQEVVTPVVMTNTIIVNASPDTLVKKTSGKVLQVLREPPKDGVKPSPSLQKKIDANELVLHYVVNGKDYYYTVPAIKNLPPLALQ
jgi:hypothetical protein